ncbi:MAG TPA: sulfurtransferase [Gammaproteobacteria bacterium]|nr:sulfurtransferase [Gammaproteobacteria bacterium]
MYDTLVDTDLLADHIGDPDWVICDCRFVLAALPASPEAGRAAYDKSHIPGAVYFHLDRDLAGPVTPASGRHPLPDPERLAATFGRAGITTGVQIVAYDDSNGAFAARLWWLARWLGHRQVAVLDGGWKKWLAEGLQTSDALTKPLAQRFTPYRNDALWVDHGSVLEVISGQQPGRVLDARSADRFRGENETLDPVAGHIPGAVNLPFAENVDPSGRFIRSDALRSRFATALNGVAPDGAICMCGSGVTACHNLLAMEVAGLKGGRLYPGSWSEWIRDPSRPVAIGS